MSVSVASMRYAGKLSRERTGRGFATVLASKDLGVMQWLGGGRNQPPILCYWKTAVTSPPEVGQGIRVKYS